MDRLRALGRRLQIQTGQTLAEYGILITVIAVIVILAAALFGTNVLGLFNSDARGV